MQANAIHVLFNWYPILLSSLLQSSLIYVKSNNRSSGKKNLFKSSEYFKGNSVGDTWRWSVSDRKTGNFQCMQSHFCGIIFFFFLSSSLISLLSENCGTFFLVHFVRHLPHSTMVGIRSYIIIRRSHECSSNRARKWKETHYSERRQRGKKKKN